RGEVGGREIEREVGWGRGRRWIAIVEHELELPRGVREPEDEAGVAVVVLEGRDYRQSEQLVESGGRGEIPGWARDPELELVQRLRPPSRGTRLRPSPAARRTRTSGPPRRRGSPTATRPRPPRGRLPPPGRRHAPASRRDTSSASRTGRRTSPPGSCRGGGVLRRRPGSARGSRGCARSRAPP